MLREGRGREVFGVKNFASWSCRLILWDGFRSAVNVSRDNAGWYGVGSPPERHELVIGMCRAWEFDHHATLYTKSPGAPELTVIFMMFLFFPNFLCGLLFVCGCGQVPHLLL